MIFFVASFQLVKRQLFVFVLWCEESLKLKGIFVDLLGSSQHNTCIVLSKIYPVLKVDIYKKHQNQVTWFVHEKTLQSFKAVAILHRVQLHFKQSCHKITIYSQLWFKLFSRTRDRVILDFQSGKAKSSITCKYEKNYMYFYSSWFHTSVMCSNLLTAAGSFVIHSYKISF